MQLPAVFLCVVQQSFQVGTSNSTYAGGGVGGRGTSRCGAESVASSCLIAGGLLLGSGPPLAPLLESGPPLLESGYSCWCLLAFHKGHLLLAEDALFRALRDVVAAVGGAEAGGVVGAVGP